MGLSLAARDRAGTAMAEQAWGPGHGGPALVGNTYLEGSYSEIYPNVSQDEAGMKRLFTQFSFPGGISSHVAPTTPRSIHERGEPALSVSPAFAPPPASRIITCDSAWCICAWLRLGPANGSPRGCEGPPEKS